MNPLRLLLLSGLAPLTLLAPVHAAEVAYPAGYRNWTHVKSMVIEPGHPLHANFGGIHHLYANARAMEGYKSGTFRDGSVIVFDLLEADAADHAIVEGKRKLIGVMHRDGRHYAATGGWGFEGFAGGDRARRMVGNDAATACFGCHEPHRQTGYVFSRWRE